MLAVQCNVCSLGAAPARHVCLSACLPSCIMCVPAVSAMPFWLGPAAALQASLLAGCVRGAAGRVRGTAQASTQAVPAAAAAPAGGGRRGRAATSRGGCSRGAARAGGAAAAAAAAAAASGQQSPAASFLWALRHWQEAALAPLRDRGGQAKIDALRDGGGSGGGACRRFLPALPSHV